MYTVIRTFHDLQDGKATKAGMIYHSYEVGDVYPREGLKPSPERIEELSGPHNAQGCPLIATDAAAEATAKLEAAAAEAKTASEAKRAPKKTAEKKAEK